MQGPTPGPFPEPAYDVFVGSTVQTGQAVAGLWRRTASLPSGMRKASFLTPFTCIAYGYPEHLRNAARNGGLIWSEGR
jgi:hypothetical protein